MKLFWGICAVLDILFVTVPVVLRMADIQCNEDILKGFLMVCFVGFLALWIKCFVIRNKYDKGIYAYLLLFLSIGYVPFYYVRALLMGWLDKRTDDECEKQNASDDNADVSVAERSCQHYRSVRYYKRMKVFFGVCAVLNIIYVALYIIGYGYNITNTVFVVVTTVCCLAFMILWVKCLIVNYEYDKKKWRIILLVFLNIVYTPFYYVRAVRRGWLDCNN